MNRCVECGAQKTADQCPACGLTSAAAEVMFRRRLGWRTAVFLVGAILFLLVGQLYPPLEFDYMLIFFGFVFFFVLTLGFFLDRRAKQRVDVEPLKRIYFAFIPLPWIFAALLFVNGNWDRAPSTLNPATVVGKFQMPGFMRWSRRLVVRSWREDQRLERVSVGSNDFDRFRNGDEVLVRVQNGALGIPWVSGVYRR
jgi:hypothetical protein